MGMLKFLLATTLSCALASYDEFLTCDKLQESRRTARLMDMIPCDMTTKTYCEYKGSAYPEHAIWRFKEENRALMKRMYGDVDSGDVYREMRSNDMFRDERSSSFDPNLITFNDNMFNSLHYNIRLSSGLSLVKGARDDKIQIRLNDRTRKRGRRTTTTTPSTTNDETATPAEPPTHSPDFGPETTTSIDPEVTKSVVTVQYSTSRVAGPTVSSTEAATTGATTTIQPSTTLPVDSYSPITTTSTPMVTDPQLGVPNTNPDLGNTDRMEMTTTGNPLEDAPTDQVFSEDDDLTDVEQLYRTDAAELWQDEETFSEEQPASVQAETSPPLNNDDISVQVSSSPEATEVEVEEELEDDLNDPLSVDEDMPDDSELFDEPQPYIGESIHACPVESEMKAPFWAKNTRNQMLALLNQRPFEQYIHIETCKFEGKQMLCRPGCRCEQQYRTHRLLAFDPKNECRGIFSDWFKFPSHCICRCHNVPRQIVETMSRGSRAFTPADQAHTGTDRQQQHHRHTGEKKSGEKSHYGGPGPTHNNNRLDNHRMEPPVGPLTFHSAGGYDISAGFPAVFPYEGKAALMAAAMAHYGEQQQHEVVKNNAAYGRGGLAPAHPGHQVGQAILPETQDSVELASSASDQRLDEKFDKFAVEGTGSLVVDASGDGDVLSDAAGEHIAILAAEEHIDNAVDDALQVNYGRKGAGRGMNLDQTPDEQDKSGAGNTNHFFYNRPILEFKLPDGTVGTVEEELPRK